MTSRRALRRGALPLLAVLAGVLLPTGAAVAAPGTPTPSPGAVTVTKAGTSFLTATAIGTGQPVKVAGSTGDYLYWSFPAAAGQTNEITVTVTLPPAAERHGPTTWSVDVFDGLRRRQACTAGAQTPTADTRAASLALGCTLRTVRAWAEPWSGDPLPGTYYLRLAATGLPEQDLGLPVQVELLVSTVDDSDPALEEGNLKAPLVPAVEPGRVLTDGASAATPSPNASPGVGLAAGEEDDGWFDGFSTRWIWTAAGGILAAVAGVVGFGLTRRPRRVTR